MNTSSYHPDYDEITPVLIVGGGLIGLSTSLFLSGQGISSLLIERHPGTAIHPRATGFSPRTMELFRSVGVEEAIRQVESTIPEDSHVLLVESLVGQEFDCLQADIKGLLTHATSPVRGSSIAQDVLEPVLRARAEQLSGDLRFGTELVACEQDEEGITATIRERGSSSTRTVRAQFLVAADGSQSGIRQQLGIGQHGTASLGHFISTIFEADLMELFRKRNAMMCFLTNDTIAIGSLVQYDGSSVRPAIYRLDVGYEPEEETLKDYPEARCLSLIRAAVGIPDLPAQIKTVLTWEMVALVADRFQQGRVFLVGDAEAHNLAWKLAAVLNGEADQRLLATYDAERRLVADYTAEQSALLSEQRQTEGSAGITVDAVIINMGYRYSAGAIVREEGNENLPLVQQPDRWTGQPGTHAPLIVLEREGKPIPMLDLFGPHFVLLVGPDGQNWKEAARNTQDILHLPLDIYQIGGDTGDLIDADSKFSNAYGITTSGAVIVRPDGFIGWRSRAAEEKEQEAEQALTQALSALLLR